jgi:protein TonB
LAIGQGLQHRHPIVPPMVLEAYFRKAPADSPPAPQDMEQFMPAQPEPQPAPVLRQLNREQAMLRKPLKPRENLVGARPQTSVTGAPQPAAASSSSAEAAPSPAQPEHAVAAATPAVALVSPPQFAAAYLRNPQPPYPLTSRRNGESGTVLLKVLVTKEGAAGRVELDRSSSFPALDRAALEAVRHWRFVPAKRGEESLDAWVRVPIVFRLEGD